MKAFHTKTLFVLFLFAMFSIKLTAGTPAGTFTITNKANVTDVTAYQNAIMNADLESFRYQDKRCTITFDNGLQVELLSAQEVQQMGLPIVITDYKTADTPGWIQPVFHLNADGTLSAMYTKPDVKQRTTTNQQ